MKLTFEQDNEKRRIVGRFILGERYQGGGGMAHGGIIATLLDEAMGKVCRFREVRAVTAELNVEYLKPVRVQSEIVVEGWETEQKGRNLFHAGEIRNAAGDVLALERVPSDIRKEGGVARMASIKIIREIMKTVTIPVMAKVRIGHFIEAEVLQALEVDFIDESEVLTPA